MESGPSFRALVFAAGSVGKSVFLFLSVLTWVLGDSGVLQCRPIIFPWDVKDAIRGLCICILDSRFLLFQLTFFVGFLGILTGVFSFFCCWFDTRSISFGALLQNVNPVESELLKCVLE